MHQAGGKETQKAGLAVKILVSINLVKLLTDWVKFELENQSPPLSLRHIIHRSGRIGYVAAAATHSYKQFILLCLNIVEPHLKEIYDG